VKLFVIFREDEKSFRTSYTRRDALPTH